MNDILMEMEIHVGDEVESLPSYGSVVKMAVTKINAPLGDLGITVSGISSDGDVYTFPKKFIKKTGRHFTSLTAFLKDYDSFAE